ncbi:conserved hypothetical protein [Trichinella spiralis]|uniref:hypothetical protein n=1 Tax=Trichinella spiralis TaxID=6334 RepID=UPI0001EFE127|nr:conserved hypothetical protein [Trichinella spiralis]
MHECVSFCTITLNRLETFMTDFKGFADEYREKKQELDAFHATYNEDRGFCVLRPEELHVTTVEISDRYCQLLSFVDERLCETVKLRILPTGGKILMTSFRSKLTGYAMDGMELRGFHYANSRLHVLSNLFTEVIIGQDILGRSLHSYNIIYCASELNTVADDLFGICDSREQSTDYRAENPSSCAWPNIFTYLVWQRMFARIVVPHICHMIENTFALARHGYQSYDSLQFARKWSNTKLQRCHMEGSCHGV